MSDSRLASLALTIILLGSCKGTGKGASRGPAEMAPPATAPMTAATKHAPPAMAAGTPRKPVARPPVQPRWCEHDTRSSTASTWSGVSRSFHRVSPRTFPPFPWRIEKRKISKYRMSAAPVEDAAGNLYVGDHGGWFFKLSRTGVPRFRVHLGGAIWASAKLSPDQKTIYVGSDDDHLYALFVRNGAVKWKRRVFTCRPKKNTDPENVKCDLDAPLTLDRRGILTGGKGVALISTDGSPLWEYNVSSHVRSGIARDGRGNHYFATLGYQIVSVDPVGKRRWSYTTTAQCDSTPTLAAPCLVVAGCDDNGLHGVDMETGTRRWKLLTGGHFRGGGALSAKGDTLYWGNTDGYLYAVNLSGRVQWRYRAGARVITPPLIDAAGNILLVPETRRLYLLNSAGDLLHTLPTPAISDSMPLITSEGRVALTTEKGQLLFVSTVRGKGKTAARLRP